MRKRASFRVEHEAHQDNVELASTSREALKARRAPLRGVLEAFIPSISLLSLSSAAQAHEGHGLPGISHWHSTDAWGFMAVGGLILFIIWLKGRK